MTIHIQTAARPQTAAELREAIAEAEYNVALQARLIGNYEALRTGPYDPGVWRDSNAWQDRLHTLRNISLAVDAQ